jgi:hypothetical protein
MVEDASGEEPDTDPLQGMKDSVVKRFSEGVEAIGEELADVLKTRSQVELDKSFVDGFLEYRESVKTHMGDEWKSDPDWWASQVLADWDTIQERARAQILESHERQMGGAGKLGGIGYGGFDRLGSLRLVDYDQFILESNAGQFREDRFYCDKGRKWFNKVKQTLELHGYPYVRKVEVEGLLVLEVSRNPMGEL